MVSEQAEQVREISLDPEEQKQLLARSLKGAYHPEDETVTVQIPMERSQALSIELVLQSEGREKIRISRWKVIQTEDYEIDDSMPVWTGGEMKEQETGK